jgi:TetR/AcrR family transcriptional regulator
VVVPQTSPGTRERILDAALGAFADHGYTGTSLNDIAEEVGIRRQSLLHHFPSKDVLYRAVLTESFTAWSVLVEDAVVNTRQGWPQVERILRAGFRFFDEHPEFVRLARREAIEGGPLLRAELASSVRPLFERAARFLDGEMEAGRLRRYDSRQLLLTGYGAILSYLSDADFVSVLLDSDPMTGQALAARREHVIGLFCHALVPEGAELADDDHVPDATPVIASAPSEPTVIAPPPVEPPVSRAS